MDDYKTMLGQLYTKRSVLELELAAVNEAIVAFERLAGVEGNGGSPVRKLPTQVTPDAFFNLTLVEGAKKYLKMVGQPARSTQEIAQALHQGGLTNASMPSLAAVLLRAAKGRQVVKVGKSHWGLNEWYPKKVETGAPSE